MSSQSQELTVPSPGAQRPAKFYIVGMGTAPDLITVRGVEVIRSADVVMVGSEDERLLWREYVRGKEVWLCPGEWFREGTVSRRAPGRMRR